MVPLPTVLAHNTSLRTTFTPTDPVAVFVGATSGIGLGALHALTKHSARPTIYIVGRSPPKLAALIAALRAVNGAATLIAVHAADLTRVADAQAAAAEIAARVGGGGGRVDLLVLSPGFVSFAGRAEHAAEGVDRVTALRFYSRVAFVLGLRAALQRAEGGARVVSVYAGGREGVLWREDLLMREQGHYGVGIAGGVAGSLNSLFFEALSREKGWEGVVFVHLFPGMVRTGLEVGGLGVIGGFLVKWIARSVVWLVGRTQEEAGERVLFVGTSARFRRLAGGGGGTEEGSEVATGSDGTVGSGVYLVQADTEAVPPTKEMVKLREEGMVQVVYDHTLDVLAKIEKGERA